MYKSVLAIILMASIALLTHITPVQAATVLFRWFTTGLEPWEREAWQLPLQKGNLLGTNFLHDLLVGGQHHAEMGCRVGQ